MPKAPHTSRLPVVDRRILGGFHWYIPRYLRKHFHAVALNQTKLQAAAIRSDDSLVIYANHSSWWDPLIAMFAAKEIFSDFNFYAPIDANALEKYRVFSKLGFFPVEQNSLQGAKHFLDVSLRLLGQSGNSIWITPEGRFADVRDHSAELMPGLSHLAHSLQRRATPTSTRTWFVPIAIECTFWEERLPEILAWFGEPALVAASESEIFSKADWNQRLTGALREAQLQLATAAIQRDESAFEVMLTGSAGTSRFYDAWRRGWARITGKNIELQHGQKLRGK
jgi:1-acyl-sn-glycerol-3-phosphate acyltransferase